MKAGLPLAISAAMLSACGAPQGGGSSAAQGPVAVSHDGAGFVVDIRPGGPGKVLTAGGAVPAMGGMIVVQREGVALAMDEGKLAKDVAGEGCRLAGGRYDPRAVGVYAGAGQWQFAGACA